jgi:hypothetical protein
MMDLSHAFSWTRWRRRFTSEAAVRADSIAEGRSPDATVDEVGVPHDNIGFDGHTNLSSPAGNGQGTGDPSSPSWAGYGL